MIEEIDGANKPNECTVDTNVDKAVDDEDVNNVKSGSKTGAYFKDGVSKIDAVLCYVTDEKDKLKEEKEKWREKFFSSLESEYHLRLEPRLKEIKDSENEEEEWEVEQEGDGDGKGREDDANQKLNEAAPAKVHFVRVHAPHDVLLNQAEDLKMKMPTKENDINIREWYQGKVSAFFDRLDPCTLPPTPKKNFFVATFDKERIMEFHNHDKPDEFFTEAERSRLVYYILQKAKYGDESTDIGIGNLIHYGVFEDTYPLHDGPAAKKVARPISTLRQKLRCNWGTFGRTFKYQPIADIREYFGEKIALYFAWLGLYTAFLIPAAIVGIACFVHGVVSSMTAPRVTESCSNPRVVYSNGSTSSNFLFYMCPLCDKSCSYYLLNSRCLYARVSHFFDNEATLVFAIFMSVWATLFLEFWKRRQISLAYEWHSIGFEEAEEQVMP